MVALRRWLVDYEIALQLPRSARSPSDRLGVNVTGIAATKTFRAWKIDEPPS
jgi:hypothetical protein